jgi:hypothetical protein
MPVSVDVPDFVKLIGNAMGQDLAPPVTPPAGPPAITPPAATVPVAAAVPVQAAHAPAVTDSTVPAARPVMETPQAPALHASVAPSADMASSAFAILATDNAHMIEGGLGALGFALVVGRLIYLLADYRRQRRYRGSAQAQMRSALTIAALGDRR